MRVLAASTAALLVGLGLEALHGWQAAPGILAGPVKLYFLAFGNVRNGLFEGFFYVALGAVLGSRGGDLARIPAWVPIAGIVVGLAGCVLVSSDAHLPFCALLGASVFLASVRRRGEAGRACAFARTSSTVIYLVHMAFSVLFAYAICGNADLNLVMTPSV